MNSCKIIVTIVAQELHFSPFIHSGMSERNLFAPKRYHRIWHCKENEESKVAKNVCLRVHRISFGYRDNIQNLRTRSNSNSRWMFACKCSLKKVQFSDRRSRCCIPLPWKLIMRTSYTQHKVIVPHFASPMPIFHFINKLRAPQTHRLWNKDRSLVCQTRRVYAIEISSKRS